MHYQAILFDLDGTLLPMALEDFLRAYFGALSKTLAPLGLKPDELLQPLFTATKAMIANQTGKRNADVFWEHFCAATGLERAVLEPVCDEFYATDFHTARAATGENPLAREAVRLAHEKADTVVLATNPLFPMVGQRTRLS